MALPLNESLSFQKKSFSFLNESDSINLHISKINDANNFLTHGNELKLKITVNNHEIKTCFLADLITPTQIDYNVILLSIPIPSSIQKEKNVVEVTINGIKEKEYIHVMYGILESA